jgi:hypothetical protein
MRERFAGLQTLQESFFPLVMDGKAVHHEWEEKCREGATFPTPFCVSNDNMTKALRGAAMPWLTLTSVLT